MKMILQFVCASCAEAASKGKYGKKKHIKAGCDDKCDCQHREPRS